MRRDTRPSFGECTWHGYDFDFEEQVYSRNTLFCYHPDMRKTGRHTVSLCGHGGTATVLESSDVCTECRFYINDPERKKLFL